MEETDRLRLMKCRDQIVQDVNSKFLLKVLEADGVLDANAVNVINAEKSDSDKTAKLLAILPSRGPKAFSCFCQALAEDYDWIVADLETVEVDSLTALKTLLMKGGVPHQPSCHITRNKELKQLRDQLSCLEAGDFLVLHGMTGSGKSVLASEAVRDTEVTLRHFPDGVFWFRVGMLDKDKLFGRMKILCEKLDSSRIPSSVDHAQDILRDLFVGPKAPYSRSLLILDDVWSADVVKAFNVGGRVLVTTQDLRTVDVVPRRFVIEVEAGFAEAESLELFSRYVGVKPEYLPDEAKAIHAECKGSPMVVSMIGGLIAENGRSRSSGRWAYYLNNLRSRKYSKFRKQRSYQHGGVMEAVMLSIENLDGRLKEKYQQLGVFLDDVGIPNKVNLVR